MLECIKINKCYGNNKIINDFSYVFEDNGFYLLFGESGSGKTTFFNILAGLIEFDSGVIEINNQKYERIVNREKISKLYDYITQDVYSVDYLSIFENLYLITDDKKEIEKTSKELGIDPILEHMPHTLSGGERQRFALVRALIAKKRIIMLDEPTAALDEENKKTVFEYLKKIKDKVLIICSSHDEMAKEYADEVILFQK